MKLLKRLIAGIVIFLLFATPAFAGVGGGATIHNAATLSFTGGQVTAHVNVAVSTVGSAPVIVSSSEQAYAGDVVTVTYTIASTSNGQDTYNLTVATNDTNVGAPGSLQINPTPLTLGASITSQPSTAGTIYIAAGSENGLSSGDTVQINIGGSDYQYDIVSVTPGSPASTTGNITTPETPTVITLTPTGGAPVIGPGTVPTGTQIGEVGTFTVELQAGTLDNDDTPGSHDIVVTIDPVTPDPDGNPITIDDSTGNVEVLSGKATLTKEVRNVTLGDAFATSGVTARPGDVLEYRITANVLPDANITGAILVDEIPLHASYVEDSTLLNGAAFGQPDSGVFPFQGAGASINSPGGGTGEILDGEVAVVTFKVEVD